MFMVLKCERLWLKDSELILPYNCSHGLDLQRWQVWRVWKELHQGRSKLEAPGRQVWFPRHQTFRPVASGCSRGRRGGRDGTTRFARSDDFLPLCWRRSVDWSLDLCFGHVPVKLDSQVHLVVAIGHWSFKNCLADFSVTYLVWKRSSFSYRGFFRNSFSSTIESSLSCFFPMPPCRRQGGTQP